MTSGAEAAATEAWAGIAREHEPDRHLAAVLSGTAVREPLLMLAAFCGELRSIPLQVSEPMIGEIRLQWWRDAITEARRGTRSGHPGADALADVIRRFDLPAEILIAMTEARAFDLYDDPMPDRAALDGYISKLECAPFELAYRVACGGAAAAGREFETIRHAGSAYGLARWLAEAPSALARGRDPLPPHLIEGGGPAHDAPADDRIVIAKTVAEGLINEARTAYEQARRAATDWEGEKRNVLLPLAIVPTYLALARRAISDGFRRRRDPLPVWRVTRIGWSRWRGRL